MLRWIKLIWEIINLDVIEVSHKIVPNSHAYDIQQAFIYGVIKDANTLTNTTS